MCNDENELSCHEVETTYRKRHFNRAMQRSTVCLVPLSAALNRLSGGVVGFPTGVMSHERSGYALSPEQQRKHKMSKYRLLSEKKIDMTRDMLHARKEVTSSSKFSYPLGAVTINKPRLTNKNKTGNRREPFTEAQQTLDKLYRRNTKFLNLTLM